MRVLNETITRQANVEDECSGRFWESRFKSHELLDQAVLMACLLNLKTTVNLIRFIILSIGLYV